MSLIVCSCFFILEGESRRLWGLLGAGCPVPGGASPVHQCWVGRHQVLTETHMCLCSAGKSPVISYCQSCSLAAFMRWANPKGDDVVGIQRGWPPVSGAELFELQEFSLCLWAVSGVSKLPPLHPVSWLNKNESGRWGLSTLWGVTACRYRQAGACDGLLGLSFPKGALLGSTVSLSSGAAGRTRSWTCSLVPFNLPSRQWGHPWWGQVSSPWTLRRWADPRDIWWGYFRVYHLQLLA